MLEGTLRLSRLRHVPNYTRRVSECSEQSEISLNHHLANYRKCTDERLLSTSKASVEESLFSKILITSGKSPNKNDIMISKVFHADYSIRV